MQQQGRIDHVFEIIDRFVRSHYNVNNEILDELLRFNRNYVIDYKDFTKLPMQHDFRYDFLGYLLDNTDLDTPCVYNFDTVEDKTMSLDRFLENMYFARKRNFGKAIVTKTQTTTTNDHNQLVTN